MGIKETKEEANARYLKAAHAMQTGVAFLMERDPAQTSPKHLRVGFNSAMVEHGALAKLLIEKGLISETEYRIALADMMEREVEIYRQRLQAEYGVEVELH